MIKKLLSYKFRLLLFLLLILLLGFFLWQKNSWSRKQFQPLQKTVSLAKEWNFQTAEKNKITFSLVSAQKTNQIYLKNKPVRTTSENTFLVLNLELKNETDKRVSFYSADFVRLLVADEKKFEADFKNPRLEIAPFSTKKDKLVFLVSAKEESFKIQVGEITGSPETVNINF